MSQPNNLPSTAAARFEVEARAAGLDVSVTWLPNPGGSGDWRDNAFRFECVIRHHGTMILTTPYWRGTGHACYRGRPLHLRETQRHDVNAAILAAVRNGKGAPHPDHVASYPITAHMPMLADVLGSLCMDDPNNATFDEWCGDLGYDPDSRKAEAIYRTVTDDTLRLRRAVGADTWSRLREFAQEL